MGDNTQTLRLKPADVTNVIGGVPAILADGVQAIATGQYHSCALVNGGVQCWGRNNVGQLGDGTIADRSFAAPVPTLTSGVTAIAAGGDFSCAIVNGGAKCWGYNANGQLGDGTGANNSTPQTVSGLTSGVQAISIKDSNHACAIVNGAMKCWGLNANGQIGNGNTANQLSPANVTGLASGVLNIAPAGNHTCALTNGGMLCWGENTYGQLGNPTLSDSSKPIELHATLP